MLCIWRMAIWKHLNVFILDSNVRTTMLGWKWVLKSGQVINSGQDEFAKQIKSGR